MCLTSDEVVVSFRAESVCYYLGNSEHRLWSQISWVQILPLTCSTGWQWVHLLTVLSVLLNNTSYRTVLRNKWVTVYNWELCLEQSKYWKYFIVMLCLEHGGSIRWMTHFLPVVDAMVCHLDANPPLWADMHIPPNAGNVGRGGCLPQGHISMGPQPASESHSSSRPGSFAEIQNNSKRITSASESPWDWPRPLSPHHHPSVPVLLPLLSQRCGSWDPSPRNFLHTHLCFCFPEHRT